MNNVFSFNLWCSRSGDHPHKDLAKFDNKQMKIKESLTFLVTCCNLIKKLAIFWKKDGWPRNSINIKFSPIWKKNSPFGEISTKNKLAS